MKKVTESDTKGYNLCNITYSEYDKDFVSRKISTMKDLLANHIKLLQNRLSELEEAEGLINKENHVYLVKDNDSSYGYVDSEGNNYEYRVIRNRPMLIDESFRLYEIKEYTEISDIGQIKGNRNVIETWIDKIVKIERI